MITNKALLQTEEVIIFEPLSEQEKMRTRIAIEIATQIQEYRTQNNFS
jgi:hypothetical protein